MRTLFIYLKAYSNLKYIVCLLSCIISLSLYANPNKILVLGDSLSAAYGIPEDEGWVSLLSQALKTTHPDWQVLNFSQSGETTSGGRQRLSQLMSQHNPQLIILELGGNDGLRGYPLIGIKKNLEAMITLGLRAHAKILLVGMKLPPNYSPQYTQKFEAIYIDLSDKYEIPLIPFLLKDVALNPNLMQSDRIHPTTQAQPIILRNILPTLLNLLS